MVKIIDFELIDFVKLILIKNELNVKWFMFEYINNKSELNNKFQCKNHVQTQKLQILTSS